MGMDNAMICLNPRQCFWLLLLMVLLYCCMHRGVQQTVAHQVGLQATRVGKKLGAIKMPVAGNKVKGYTPPFALSAVRTPSGLLKKSEGLTVSKPQHYCSARGGGCLKDVKTEGFTVESSFPQAKGKLTFTRNPKSENFRNGGWGQPEYERPDADSQYTQWSQSAWTSSTNVPGYTTINSTPVNVSNISAYAQMTADDTQYEAWNPVYPGQDVARTYNPDLNYPQQAKN